MTTTLEQPQASRQPDSGVIEEARRRQRRHRLAAAAATIAAIAVGVAAWLTAGGGDGSRPVGAHRYGAPSAAAGSRHESAGCAAVYGRGLDGKPEPSLLSILGVLRRPATPVDSLPAGVGGIGDVFVRYVRRTRVLDGSSYYLYPALQGCRPGHQAIDTATTHVDLGHGILGGVGSGDTSTRQIETGQAASTGPPGSDTSATITMIVPDGVASVTLRYPAGRASGYSPRISPPFTVTTAVVGNEVVVTVPRSAGGGPIWKPTMIWRGARGRIRRVFHRL
jgi:hypothetical protein